MFSQNYIDQLNSISLDNKYFFRKLFQLLFKMFLQLIDLNIHTFPVPWDYLETTLIYFLFIDHILSPFIFQTKPSGFFGHPLQIHILIFIEFPIPLLFILTRSSYKTASIHFTLMTLRNSRVLLLLLKCLMSMHLSPLIYLLLPEYFFMFDQFNSVIYFTIEIVLFLVYIVDQLMSRI